MLRMLRRSLCLLMSWMVYALYAFTQSATCSARPIPAGAAAASRARYSRNSPDWANAS